MNRDFLQNELFGKGLCDFVSGDFDQNDCHLRSLPPRTFNEKFALQKTYQIVSDVPQAI